MTLSASLARLVRDAIKAALFDVHTAFPARVESVSRDGIGWRVDAKPMGYRYLAKMDGGELQEELPVIPDVPVVWPASGGWGIAMPIEEGDHVLIVASEHATGQWRARGTLSDPQLRERHGLSGCFAIPGAGTALRKFADGVSSAAQSGIVIGKDGGIQISMSSTEIKLGRSASSYAAKADAVLDRLQTIVDGFNGHTHVGVTAGTGTSGVPSPASLLATPVASVAASKVKVE
ncbi:MAG: hypothetical protein K1X94_28520 [Sandaracinaceae bacterium]|nr:hypothetical protein [Sandaracinaceae bacterium]